MGIFLRFRFENKLKPVYALMLSLSYAFMQYNLTQADNVMWLDGVYMLPLIILGVYKAVNNKKYYTSVCIGRACHYFQLVQCRYVLSSVNPLVCV